MIERFLLRLKKSARASLVDAIRGLSDAEAREVVKEAKPGLHLHVNPKGRKKKEVESNAE
jgi:hypothetical protein